MMKFQYFDRIWIESFWIDKFGNFEKEFHFQSVRFTATGFKLPIDLTF